MKKSSKVKFFSFIIALFIICLYPVYKINASTGDFVIEDGVLKKYKGDGGAVIIPDTVKSIYSFAFSGNGYITSVTIPNSVELIGSNAFRGCDLLTDISIPKTVTSIGSGSFALTPWLEKKQKENPLVIVNGILIDGTYCKGEITLPDTITSICDNAFSGNKNITAITIQDSVTYIGYSAFYNCMNLVTVKMADSVTDIGTQAFRRCTKLKNITLSKSITIIQEGVFQGCSKLSKITIPGLVKTIDYNAFYLCKNLKYVSVADKVTEADGVFERCHKNLTLYGFSGSYIQDYAKENNISFKKLAINTLKVTLPIGKTTNLKLNSLSECTWKSSNKCVAIVDKYGKVTAKKKGTAVIAASRYGKKFKCTVTVK